MSHYQMHRGWMDHPAFKAEPYTEREAFEWMIAEAQWKDGVVPVKGQPIKLKRGQLTASFRFMAQKFQWTIDKVRWYVGKLEKWSICTTDHTAHQTIITICNYETYQAKPHTQHTQNPTGTPQEPHKLEEIQELQEGKKEVVDAAPETVFSQGEQIAEVVGWKDDPRWMGNYSRLQVWLDSGWSFELDILPTVRRLAANKTGPPPSSLNYFEKAIADAYATRMKPIPEGTAHAKRPHSPSAVDALFTGFADSVR